MPIDNDSNYVPWVGSAPWDTEDNNTRLPTPAEYDAGFPCGAADEKLFNYLFAYTMGQLKTLISYGPMPIDEVNLLQTAIAIQSGKMNYAFAGGTANNIQASLNPTLGAYIPGLRIALQITANNTGVVTLDVDGLGPKPVKNSRGADMIANALAVGDIADLVYNGTEWRSVHKERGDRNFALITTSGNFTVPAGVFALEVQVWGGGGGGGGVATLHEAAGGGGGGGYAAGVLNVTPGQIIPAVIGAGGAAGGGGGSGGAGGASSFLTLSATGGSGGAPNPDGAGGIGGAGSGGILNLPGSTGAQGFRSATTGIGGGGGGSYNGNPGNPDANGNGAVGKRPGGGGSGAGGIAAVGTGGAGGPGMIFIRY